MISYDCAISPWIAAILITHLSLVSSIAKLSNKITSRSHNFRLVNYVLLCSIPLRFVLIYSLQRERPSVQILVSGRQRIDQEDRAARGNRRLDFQAQVTMLLSRFAIGFSKTWFPPFETRFPDLRTVEHF